MVSCDIFAEQHHPVFETSMAELSKRHAVQRIWLVTTFEAAARHLPTAPRHQFVALNHGIVVDRPAVLTEILRVIVDTKWETALPLWHGTLC